MPTAVKMSHAPDIQWSHSFRGPGELGMGVAWTGHSKKNSNVMGSSRTHTYALRNTHTQSHSNTDRHCMHYTTTHARTDAHTYTHTLQPMSGAWPHENTLFWRRWMEAPKSYTSCHKHWRDNNDTNRCVQCGGCRTTSGNLHGKVEAELLLSIVSNQRPLHHQSDLRKEHVI